MSRPLIIAADAVVVALTVIGAAYAHIVGNETAVSLFAGGAIIWLAFLFADTASALWGR